MYSHTSKTPRVLGFTLIELMVVISIISLLSSVLLASFSISRMKARDAERVTATRSITNALELYYAKNQHYPCSNLSDSRSASFLADLVTQGFLPKKLTDPVNSGGKVYGYVSLKSEAGGQCGAYAIFTYDIEVPGTQCIQGGKFVTSTHCHIPFPGPLTCGDPWLDNDSGSVCASLFY